MKFLKYCVNLLRNVDWYEIKIMVYTGLVTVGVIVVGAWGIAFLVQALFPSLCIKAQLAIASFIGIITIVPFVVLWIMYNIDKMF